MTPFIKKKDIKKDWYIINAQNAAVGRLMHTYLKC